ncbi:Transposase (plasmid) [Shigella dysenteriae 1617]|uniref:Transposase n=1 Tax=Shigella dysenteriae 1617 TaxID=754093 RepID=A0A0A7A5B7_SHIDY|nr:Transposase [Shigella dysenteriae 1617]
MAFNGAGVRDTARTLKIGINTVIRTLKNSPPKRIKRLRPLTQRIERNNLTLRTRIKRLARKTICFSRSVEIHEKVIGTFIEKHMFY